MSLCLLLLLLLLLHHAPYVTVDLITQSGNHTKKKLSGKKSIFGNLSPLAVTLLAVSFGFTVWKVARGAEESQFIQRRQWPLCPSHQPAQLPAEVGESPPLEKSIPALAPQGDGCASLQVLISTDCQALQLEVSFQSCCCLRSRQSGPLKQGPGGTAVLLASGTRSSWTRIWCKQAASSKDNACSPSSRKYLEDNWQSQKC